MKNKMKDAGITDFRVTSAGVSAIRGGKMSMNSFRALKKMGVTTSVLSNPMGIRG